MVFSYNLGNLCTGICIFMAVVHYILFFRHLNRSATIIQRRWRGFIGRNCFRILVKVFIPVLTYQKGNIHAEETIKSV